MTKLPEDPHEIVRLFYHGLGLTYAKTGEVLGISASRVKQIVKKYEPFKGENGWTVRKGE